MEDCIFCSIASGQMDADILYSDDQVVAFRDINPVAPVHFLAVPRRHIISLLDLTPQDAPVLFRLFEVIAKVAGEEGIASRGMRVLTNVGKEAGQVIMHLHFHVLGGRGLGWPPG